MISNKFTVFIISFVILIITISGFVSAKYNREISNNNENYNFTDMKLKCTVPDSTAVDKDNQFSKKDFSTEREYKDLIQGY